MSGSLVPQQTNHDDVAGDGVGVEETIVDVRGHICDHGQASVSLEQCVSRHNLSCRDKAVLYVDVVVWGEANGTLGCGEDHEVCQHACITVGEGKDLAVLIVADQDLAQVTRVHRAALQHTLSPTWSSAMATAWPEMSCTVAVPGKHAAEHDETAEPWSVQISVQVLYLPSSSMRVFAGDA